MSNPGGKGSTQRPFSVTQEQYAKRWDAIFGKDLSMSEKRAKESADFEQVHEQLELEAGIHISQQITDSAEIRRVFEGDDDDSQ